MTRPLVLIPTEMELARLRPRLDRVFAACHAVVEICGFGPIAAAVTTSRLLGQQRPSQVLLLGIAGAYSERQAVGSAYCFAKVACYGVGAGVGASHHTGAELGWTSPDLTHFEMAVPDSIPAEQMAGLMLTCCSASANQQEVDWKLDKFPTAEAEDMEGYGVAAACHAHKIPCSMIRGISNYCGDRDQKNWQTHEALDAVSELAERLLSELNSTRRSR